MASFDKYAPKLKRWEGGFGNDPDDPGGATMCGVTLATFRAHFGQTQTVEDLKRMTTAQWTHIMKGGFWDKLGADGIKNQSVAEIMVDWLVNSGTGRIRDIQAIVGTKVDGISGPKTVNAINGYNQQVLHYKIKAARAKWYIDIVARRISQVKFFECWWARLADFQYSR